jgi:hypothetical protein
MALAARPWWSLDARIVKYGARKRGRISQLLVALLAAEAGGSSCCAPDAVPALTSCADSTSGFSIRSGDRDGVTPPR